MPETNPFISIVVPTYNRADLIAKTLKTLQQQDYPHYEIIVVDDGSTDNTEDIVRSVANHRTHYVRKENGERAAARNFGARMAKGSYVNFFDSDDLALNNHLAEAARMIHQYQEPEWFHLGYAFATPEGQVFRVVNSYKGTTLNPIMSQGNPLSCNGVFIRKDICLQHLFVEERTLSASEDYELWLRLAARYPLYYSNAITSWVIDHEMRSVRRINGEKLINRLKYLLYSLQKDNQVLNYYGADFKKVKADAYSYIALHLAEQPHFKSRSISFLYKALKAYPGMVAHKRFYAVIKNILIKWQRF